MLIDAIADIRYQIFLLQKLYWLLSACLQILFFVSMGLRDAKIKPSDLRLFPHALQGSFWRGA